MFNHIKNFFKVKNVESSSAADNKSSDGSASSVPVQLTPEYVKILTESISSLAAEAIEQKKMLLDLYMICGVLIQNDPKLSNYLKQAAGAAETKIKKEEMN